MPSSLDQKSTFAGPASNLDSFKSAPRVDIPTMPTFAGPMTSASPISTDSSVLPPVPSFPSVPVSPSIDTSTVRPPSESPTDRTFSPPGADKPKSLSPEGSLATLSESAQKINILAGSENSPFKDVLSAVGKTAGQLGDRLGQALQNPKLAQFISDRLSKFEGICTKLGLVTAMSDRHAVIASTLNVIGGKLVYSGEGAGREASSEKAVESIEGKEGQPIKAEASAEQAETVLSPGDLRGAYNTLKNQTKAIAEYEKLMGVLSEAGLPSDLCREKMARQFGPEQARALDLMMKHPRLPNLIQGLDAMDGLTAKEKNGQIMKLVEMLQSEPQAEAPFKQGGPSEALEGGAEDEFDSEAELDDPDHDGESGAEETLAAERPAGQEGVPGTKAERREEITMEASSQTLGIDPGQMARMQSGELLRLQALQESGGSLDGEQPYYPGKNVAFDYKGKTDGPNALRQALSFQSDQMQIANALGNSLSAMGDDKLQAFEGLLKASLGERLGTLTRTNLAGGNLQAWNENTVMKVDYKGGKINIKLEERRENEVRQGEVVSGTLHNSVTLE